MKGVIIAGGKGKRLVPLTNKLPKPMLKVAGKPLLEHQINLFRKYKINKLLLCLHYLPEKIMGYFKNGSDFGVQLEYSVEKKPMGTAGALNLAKNLKNFFDQAFIAMYGDNFTNLNLKKLADFHNRKKSFATIVLYKKKLEEKSSSLIVKGKNSRIRKIVEGPDNRDLKNLKGKYKYVNAGIYVLEPEILKFIPKRKFDFAYDLFPVLLKKRQRVYGYDMPKGTILREIGTIKKLNSARKELKGFK